MTETEISEDTTSKKKKKKKEKKVDDRTLGQKVVSELKFFVGLFAFLIVFWTTIFGHYKIPSESMQPTLEVGDHLYVSKFAYGYSRHSLPLNLHKLPFLPERGKIFSKIPKRGDVVVFRHPYSGIVMIKRVVGLPGDTIKVDEGRLYINGDMIERVGQGQLKYRRHLKKGERPPAPVAIAGKFEEQFPGEKDPHIIYEEHDDENSRADYFDEITVPEGHIFFMGDNRDNSKDSRMRAGPNMTYVIDGKTQTNSGPGLVPLDHLIGRADLIMFSFKKCRKEPGFHCPKRRYLTKIK